MPSHFSSIGLPADSVEEIEALAFKVIDDTTTLNCPKGRYLRWGSGEGAELWLQVDEEYNLVGMTPFFKGKSSMNVGVTEVIHRESDTVLEGAVLGCADPKLNDPHVGAFPFVFDVVDIGLYRNMDVPFISPIRLTAFAYDLDVYSSLEDFHSQQSGVVKLAPDSFVPSASFPTKGETPPVPESYAEISGRVLETSRLQNSFTYKDYYWIFIRTSTGTVDIVCDPALVSEPIKVGGLVSGFFGLCGQILEPRLKVKKTLKQILLGR